MRNYADNYGYMRTSCRHWRQPVRVGRYTVLCSSISGATGTELADRRPVGYGIYLSLLWQQRMGGIWTNGTGVRSVLKKRDYPAVVVDWVDMGGVDSELIDELVEICREKIHRGRLVDIGCNGGHGRTGTFLACLIARVEHLSAEAAIAEARRRYCRLAVEGKAQEQCVREYVRQYGWGRRAPRPLRQMARKILATWAEKPWAREVEIGRQCGVSCEYVRQVGEYLDGLTRTLYWVEVALHHGWHPCPVCGTLTRKFQCSPACYRKAHWAILTCEECGRQFERRMTYVRRDAKKKHEHIFCGRHCLGVHGARIGGFGIHPENQRHGVGRKWNWGWVRQVWMLSGWSQNRVARYLGIPYPTVHDILKAERR